MNMINNVINYLKDINVEKNIMIFLIASYMIAILYYLLFITDNPNDHLTSFIYNL